MERRGFALIPTSEMGVKIGEVFLVKVSTKPFPTQLRVVLSRVIHSLPLVEYVLYIADRRVGEFTLGHEGGTIVNFGNPHIELGVYTEEILEGLEVQLARWPDHDKIPTDRYEPEQVVRVRAFGNAIRHIKGLYERIHEKLQGQLEEGHQRGTYPKRPGKGRGGGFYKGKKK